MRPDSRWSILFFLYPCFFCVYFVFRTMLYPLQTNSSRRLLRTMLRTGSDRSLGIITRMFLSIWIIHETLVAPSRRRTRSCTMSPMPTTRTWKLSLRTKSIGKGSMMFDWSLLPDLFGDSGIAIPLKSVQGPPPLIESTYTWYPIALRFGDGGHLRTVQVYSQKRLNRELELDAHRQDLYPGRPY